MSDLDDLPRFKPEFAWLHEAWCDALESGDYQQTTGTLRDKSGYCCLGVLKKVAQDNGIRLKANWDQGDLYVRDLERLTGTSDVNAQNPLINRNDGVDGHRRHSFKQIARIVRKRMAPEVAA